MFIWKVLATNFSIRQWVLSTSVIIGAWSVSLWLKYLPPLFPFSQFLFILHILTQDSFSSGKPFLATPARRRILASQYTSISSLLFLCFLVSHPAWTSWGEASQSWQFFLPMLSYCLVYNKHSMYVCRINEWMNTSIIVFPKFISRLNNFEFLLV